MSAGAISISCTDLDAVRSDFPGGTLIALGLTQATVDDLASRRASADQIGQAVRKHKNAVAVVVSPSSDPDSVIGFRGIFSEIDLFYALLDDGSLIVADHFRNAISHVPVGGRETGPDALVEHYLCGWVYDTRTYSKAVDRLGMGERFTYSISQRTIGVEQFDRVTPITEDDGATGLVARVEKALADRMTPLVGDSSVCATFSGGVDSTLLASFLSTTTPLVAMTTDTSEFDIETEYAETAAGLLGRPLSELRVLEKNYAQLLDDLIETTAVAPAHYVMPMLACLYDRPETTFILGEGADSVFGTDRGLRRIAGTFANRFGLAALGLGRRLPGVVGYRSGQVLAYASEFAEEPSSNNGAAARSLLFGDPSLVQSIVGEDAVERVLELHLSVVFDRVDLEVPQSDRFNSHMEIIRWRHTMSDLASLDRHSAQAAAKRSVQPYVHASVIDALRQAPAEKRYVKGLAGKWVLKEMLADRVPEYPVNQRKNATGLPFDRYYTSGPLNDVWSRYDVPDFVPASKRSSVVDSPSPVTWNAITHAIWTEKVARNRDLVPLPSTVEYSSRTTDVPS